VAINGHCVNNRISQYHSKTLISIVAGQTKFLPDSYFPRSNNADKMNEKISLQTKQAIPM